MRRADLWYPLVTSLAGRDIVTISEFKRIIHLPVPGSIVSKYTLSSSYDNFLTALIDLAYICPNDKQRISILPTDIVIANKLCSLGYILPRDTNVPVDSWPLMRAIRADRVDLINIYYRHHAYITCKELKSVNFNDIEMTKFIAEKNEEYGIIEPKRRCQIQ
jgi:hypothetical protein